MNPKIGTVFSEGQQIVQRGSSLNPKSFALKTMAKASIGIVIDKYDVVWYGLFVFEGNLRKVPSSSRSSRLFDSLAAPHFSEGFQNKRLSCHCMSEAAGDPVGVREETLI